MADCKHTTLRLVKVTDLDWPRGEWMVYQCISCNTTFQYPGTFVITRGVKIEVVK